MTSPSRIRDPIGVVVSCRVRPEQAAIVGDSHVDIRTGHNAGLWTIAVTYGFAPHTLEQEAPDVSVDTPEELSSIFLSQRSLQENK